MTSQHFQKIESSKKKRPIFFSRYSIILIGLFSIFLYVCASVFYLKNDEVISVSNEQALVKQLVWIPGRYSQGYTRIVIETSRGHLITLQDPRRFENINAGDHMNVRVQITQRGNVRYSIP
jgi:hypothetical protein